MYDLIIVGGGPAGLTAAIYAIRKRINVLLVSADLGGKTNYHMELKGEDHYQLIRGADIVEKYRGELEYLHFAYHQENVTKIQKPGEHYVVHTEGGGELAARTVLLATGATVQRLNIPGEMEFRGRGLGYSALSYAPLFLDREVFVVGDGDLALRATAELATVARQVHLVASGLDSSQSPLANKLTHTPNVEVLVNHKVVRVEGTAFVEKVVVQTPDGSLLEVPTDGVFVEKALIPNTRMIEGLGVEMDELGRVKVDCQGRTNLPGLFAAGDVTNSTEQILVAVGDGAKASIAAYNYLLPYL